MKFQLTTSLLKLSVSCFFDKNVRLSLTNQYKFKFICYYLYICWLCFLKYDLFCDFNLFPVLDTKDECSRSGILWRVIAFNHGNLWHAKEASVCWCNNHTIMKGDLWWTYGRLFVDDWTLGTRRTCPVLPESNMSWTVGVSIPSFIALLQASQVHFKCANVLSFASSPTASLSLLIWAHYFLSENWHGFILFLISTYWCPAAPWTQVCYIESPSQQGLFCVYYKH